MPPKKFWLGFKNLAENFGSKSDANRQQADERRTVRDLEVTSIVSRLKLFNIVSNNVAKDSAVQINAPIHFHPPGKSHMLKLLLVANSLQGQHATLR